jgi:predicted TIM-barrel fold metal-dependent hydrolase
VNVGVPGPLRFAKYQRPMDLDDVLVSLPEVKIVMTRRHPWHLETVALPEARQLLPDDLRLGPKHVPAEIIHLMNTRGQHKVMWSADYPIQTFERCIARRTNCYATACCAGTCATTPDGVQVR